MSAQYNRIMTDIVSMFDGAVNFNQPIGDWNVSSLNNMNSMFYLVYVIYYLLYIIEYIYYI